MLSKIQTLEVLGSEMCQAITEIIEKANRHRLRSTSDAAAIMDARTRACWMNNLMVHYATRRLVPLGAKVIKSRNRVLFDIKGVLLLTFKKLGKNRAARNYPTPFAQSFNAQTELAGIPAQLDRVVAGYTPKPDWSSYEVYVTQPNGKGVTWAEPLERESNLTEIPKPKTNEKKPKRNRIKGSTTIPDVSTGTENR